MSFEQKIREKAKTHDEWKKWITRQIHSFKMDHEWRDWLANEAKEKLVKLKDVLAVYAEEKEIWNGKVEAYLLTLKVHKTVEAKRKQKLQQFRDYLNSFAPLAIIDEITNKFEELLPPVPQEIEEILEKLEKEEK